MAECPLELSVRRATCCGKWVSVFDPVQTGHLLNFVTMAYRLITSRSRISRLRLKLVCTTPIITESRQATIDYLLRPRKTPPQDKSFWNWRQHVKKSPIRSTTVAQADSQMPLARVLGQFSG
jgi:hypothetical protein